MLVIDRKGRLPVMLQTESESELEACLTRGICQSGDSSMITISPTIETDCCDALFLGTFGNEFTDQGRCGLVAAIDRILAGFRFDGSCGNQGSAEIVVDELRVNMLGTTENGKSRPFGRTMKTPPRSKLSADTSYRSCRFFAHEILPFRGSGYPMSDRTAPPAGKRLIGHLEPNALPDLRRTTSPSYRTPLPLYGSGGLVLRSSAAN